MKDKDHLFAVDKQYFRNLKSLPDNNPTYIRVDIGNRIVKSFRLDLIPLKKADMPEYYKLYSDATVVEKYCKGKPRPPKEIDELLSPYFYDEEPSYFSIFKKDLLNGSNKSSGFFSSHSFFGLNFNKYLLTLLPWKHDKLHLTFK